MARRNWPFAKMIALIRFVFGLHASLCNAKGRLEAEDAVLRQQLIALRRKSQVCARLTNDNRRSLVQPYRWFPSIHDVLTIIRPETVARWHRGGFRRHWHWKMRRGGRQQLPNKLRVPIRQGSSMLLVKRICIGSGDATCIVIPGSRQNPKILRIDDAEVVGDRIAKFRPAPWNLFA
jgi:hypothetical protein